MFKKKQRFLNPIFIFDRNITTLRRAWIVYNYVCIGSRSCTFTTFGNASISLNSQLWKIRVFTLVMTIQLHNNVWDIIQFIVVILLKCPNYAIFKTQNFQKPGTNTEKYWRIGTTWDQYKGLQLLQCWWPLGRCLQKPGSAQYISESAKTL